MNFSRWIFSVVLAGACVYPVLSHQPLYPFLPYSMFTVDKLRRVYFLPIATRTDGSEYLMRRRDELYPYRLTGGIDLQPVIERELEKPEQGRLKEFLKTWCRRVSHCESATLYRYTKLFKDGRVDLTTPREKLVSVRND